MGYTSKEMIAAAETHYRKAQRLSNQQSVIAQTLSGLLAMQLAAYAEQPSAAAWAAQHAED